MKNILVCFIIGLTVISCTNHDTDKTIPMPELNINYPAAYVVNGASNDIYVIDLATNEVKEVIKLNGMQTNSMKHGSMDMPDGIFWPHHIAINNSKTQLALGVPGMDLSAGHTGGMAGMKGMIALIDATKGMVSKKIDLPVMNHNAIYSNDGKEIWTSQMMENGEVLVYDATTFVLKNIVKVGGDPAEVTFSVDGTLAFVCNGMDSTVSLINTLDKTVLKTLKVGADPVGAWVALDGKVYVDNEKSKTVTIIDAATLSVIGTIDLGFMPGYVAYNLYATELWITDPEAGKVHYWTWDLATKTWFRASEFETGAGAHAIAFTLDGKVAYITNQTSNKVSVINVIDHKKIKDINVGSKPNGIVIKN